MYGYAVQGTAIAGNRSCIKVQILSSAIRVESGPGARLREGI
jgi:hypothetical protein